VIVSGLRDFMAFAGYGFPQTIADLKKNRFPLILPHLVLLLAVKCNYDLPDIPAEKI
jgi:hypothetical protein